MENNELLQRSVEIGETTFGLVKCEGKPDSQILDWTVTFQLGVFCSLTLTRLDSRLHSSNIFRNFFSSPAIDHKKFIIREYM